MELKGVQMFESACKRARFYIENDMPIGVFHDILLELKGLMVDRMVAAHKEQEQQAEQMKKLDQVSEGE